MKKRVGIERLVAAFLDSIFIGIIVFIPTTLFYVLYVGVDNLFDYFVNSSGSGLSAAVGDTTTLITITVVELALGILYFVYVPFKKNGQTLGKMILRVKVVNELGENPGFKAHFIRAIQIWGNYFGVIILVTLVFNDTIFAILSVLIAVVVWMATVISTIMLIARTDEKGLHDLIADTMVVKVDEDLNTEFINKTTQISDWAKVVDEDDEFGKVESEDSLKPKDDEWE